MATLDTLGRPIVPPNGGDPYVQAQNESGTARTADFLGEGTNQLAAPEPTDPWARGADGQILTSPGGQPVTNSQLRSRQHNLQNELGPGDAGYRPDPTVYLGPGGEALGQDPYTGSTVLDQQGNPLQVVTDEYAQQYGADAGLTTRPSDYYSHIFSVGDAGTDPYVTQGGNRVPGAAAPRQIAAVAETPEQVQNSSFYPNWYKQGAQNDPNYVPPADQPRSPTTQAAFDLGAQRGAFLDDAGNVVVPGAAGGAAGGGGGGGRGPIPSLNQQMSVPRQTAFDLTNQGQAVNQQSQALMGGFQQQAANFNPQAQQVAGNGFNTGQQVQAQNFAAPGMIDPNSLGGVGNITGQLGAGPGNIAGRLGGAPTIGNVGNIAGQLGAAPQVGDVGNIQMGAGPGNIAGLLSNMGQSSQGQAGMMQRLEGFLDQAPGPSVAEAQLQQVQADNMAELIGRARSGRGGAGAQAQALRGALSEGGAIASDTAGQMATLRAQEEDMLRNRQLAGIGLGGQLSTSMRGQDIQYRGQDLGALMSDQATQLGTRGQDLQGAMANQSTQTALEQLRANTALGARGQNLGALQSDQSTQAQLAAARGQLALGARGQDLGALQSDQSTQLGVRGQNLQGLTADQATQLGLRGQNANILTSNQATQLGTRGQNINQETSLAATNAMLRGQDADVLSQDANRALDAQRLGLQGQVDLGRLGIDARGQGLDFLGEANEQGLTAEQMAQDAINNANRNQTMIDVANIGDPSMLESLGGPILNTVGRILFPGG